MPPLRPTTPPPAHPYGPAPFPSLSPSQPLSEQQLLLHAHYKRQGILPIPILYQNQNSSPAPGAVVGIVLGSVAAFLLLIWLFSTITGRRGPALISEQEVVVSTGRRRSRSPPRSSRRSRRTEMRSRSPARRERIVRQERIVRDTSRPAPAAASAPQRTYVEERYTAAVPPPAPANDFVEVVEEGESSIVTAPRRKSKKGGSRYG